MMPHSVYKNERKKNNVIQYKIDKGKMKMSKFMKILNSLIS